MSIFSSFRSTATPFLSRPFHKDARLLVDAVTGAPAGIQSPNGAGPDGIWTPVDLTAAQIASPSALMIADLNAVYRLNVAPYTRYRSNGTALVEMVSTNLAGLLYESATDGLTAHAGGGQGSALALTTELNRIATVATAGDSVALPASAPGLTIILENAAANPMQVYGAGTDTINGVATGTGVSQMAGSVVIYTCYSAGAWYANGLGTGYSGSFETISNANGLTAHAGGGQGSATPITTMLARFTTVATGGDSSILPTSAPGMNLVVTNAAASNAMNVFPDTGGQINALGANAAFSLAAGKTATFYCSVALQWHAILSA